jgi:hypothetical protein
MCRDPRKFKLPAKLGALFKLKEPSNRKKKPKVVCRRSRTRHGRLESFFSKRVALDLPDFAAALNEL